MGDLAGGDAPPVQGGVRDPDDRDDVARIADAVRDAVDARTALISRVVDDEWLEVVAVSGHAAGADRAGHRWLRAELARDLDGAERHGRLHVASRPDAAVLHAPLHTQRGELVGVLSTVGPVAADDLGRELVELYADQARLALDLLHEHHVLVEHLRLSAAAQSILYAALERPDVPELLESVAAPLAAMMRAGAAWTCTEVASGVYAEAASYPDDVGGRLGVDLCTLVEPMVDTCWSGDTTLSEEDSPLLGRIAGLAHQQRALLAAIGSGTTVRGALLVLRGEHEEPWAEYERDALAGLGRRLGSVVEQLENRRRDRHLVDELRELDQYRRDLVASLTHDLKTPLTAIALNAELLESDRRLAEAGVNPVAAIRRSAERLSGLVDDLLALARAEEGGTGEERRDADAVALVREACRHAEVEAQPRGVRFVLDLPERLEVGVDGDALARVYVNVISNAAKFSLPDGEVRISLRAAGGSVEMTCADDGVGISEADQATVFDMFRRASNAHTHGVPGSGVGLAISQRIVARLGGSIELASTPGEGSTFVVRVPAAR